MGKTVWLIDPAHSFVSFKVRHLMITIVTGKFRVISGTAETVGENFSQTRVTFTADVNSLDTGDENRDTHLRSVDFFDVAKYPDLKFEADNYNAGENKISGKLTMKNVTKPVELDVKFNGLNVDPWGKKKAGFTISGKINRTQWGLTWNAALEKGGVLVSEEVEIICEIQLMKEQ